MIVKVIASQAQKIARKTGIDLSGDGKTYYAVDSETYEIYSFDSKKKRDQFVEAVKEMED